MKKRYISKVAKWQFTQIPYAGRFCALYIRVSKDEFKRNEAGEKERRQSVKTQTADAIEYAKKNGWEYKVYDADCDISGGEELQDRPALQELKADIEAKKVHTVLVRKLDRIFRNRDLQEFFRVEVFRPNGVDIRLINDSSFSLFSQSGKLNATIQGVQNEDFLIALSETIIRNKNNAVSEGKLRTSPPFGYGIKEIDGIRGGYIRENEAEIIKEVFKRCINGEGVKTITLDLIQRGVKTKRGNRLHTSTVLKWLRNPAYKGRLIYNGKEGKNPYPVLIPVEEWQKANEQITTRATSHGINRGGASNTHLLTGLLQCGYCGDRLDRGEITSHNVFRNMVYSFNSTIRKNENGKSGRVKYHQYRCQTKGKHNASACPDSISVNAESYEKVIKELVRTMIEYDYSKTLIKTNSKFEQIKLKIEQAEIKLGKFNDRKKEIKQRYAGLDIEQKEYDDLIEMIDGNISKVEIELNSLKEQKEIYSGTATVEALNQLGKWDTLTLEQQKTGLHKLFDKIKLYSDRMEIYYKATPDEAFIVPIRYVKHKGYQPDFISVFDKLMKDLNKRLAKHIGN